MSSNQLRTFGPPRLGLIALIFVLQSAPLASAQQLDRTAAIGAHSIPIDGMLVALLNPAKAMQSPTVELMPTEVADGWCAEYIGLKPSEIDSAKIVVAVPGAQQPMFAAVLTLNRDFDITTLHPEVIGDAQRIDVDGHSCLPVQAPGNVVIHQVDARHVIVSSRNYLNSVITSADGESAGALAKLAETTSHEGQVTVLFAIEPVRPIVTGFLQTVIDQIPPPFVEFTVIPQLTDAITLTIDIDDREQGVRLTLLAKDDASADELQKVVGNGLNMARDMALVQAAGQWEGQGPVAKASQEYAKRLADHIVKSFTPKRAGRRLTIATAADQGMATQAILLGMLMPAVQSARVAAGRASSRNNLRQIALAMHNHHDAFRALPDNAIRDEDGKPLLSWRVKILPFIEQQALYDQFHLDEPWDSPHNIELLDQMPDVYKHPKVRTADGTTIYQLPVGETTIFKKIGAPRFRDITDGTSNTIMVMETNADAAVEWTRPADIEIDMDDPLASAGDHSGGTFQVVLADGASRVLSRDIDLETLRALLTAAGGERVDF